MKAFALFLISLFSFASLFAQATDDDVYFSPKDPENEPVAAVKEAQKQPVAESYDDDYSDGYYDDEDNYTNSSETHTDGQGNTYITNNYYGDYYQDDYSTKLNRYYNPYSGFGYYSPCYNSYYDPYYGGGWSVSVNFGWGYPNYGYYGYSSFGYGYPYYGYGYPYYPYYGGGYCGGGYYGGGYYGGGYCNGYNNGYWDGYHDGYYGGGYYGSGGYYYGPRTGGNGYSSYRNSQRQTEEVEAPVRTVNQFPVDDNNGSIQPVRETQVPGKTIAKEKEMQPSRTPVTSGNTYGTVEKGNVQPARNETKTVDRYDMNDKGNVQPVRSTEVKEVSPKPNTSGYIAPQRNEEVERAPVERENIAPKPTTNPNVERQSQPAKYDYNRNLQQRGGMIYEHNDEPEPHHKGNSSHHQYTSPTYERNEDAQKQNPQRYVPQNDNAHQQQHNSPKTYDRGTQSAPRTFDRGNDNYSAPAPSNKGSGAPVQHAPQGGSRMQPR